MPLWYPSGCPKAPQTSWVKYDNQRTPSLPRKCAPSCWGTFSFYWMTIIQTRNLEVDLIFFLLIISESSHKFSLPRTTPLPTSIAPIPQYLGQICSFFRSQYRRDFGHVSSRNPLLTPKPRVDLLPSYICTILCGMEVTLASRPELGCLGSRSSPPTFLAVRTWLCMPWMG